MAARPRGRPAFAWDAFHLEVTDLLLRKELPEKKGSCNSASPGMVREISTSAPGSVIDWRKTKALLQALYEVGRQKLRAGIFCLISLNNCPRSPLSISVELALSLACAG